MTRSLHGLKGVPATPADSESTDKTAPPADRRQPEPKPASASTEPARKPGRSIAARQMNFEGCRELPSQGAGKNPPTVAHAERGPWGSVQLRTVSLRHLHPSILASRSCFTAVSELTGE